MMDLTPLRLLRFLLAIPVIANPASPGTAPASEVREALRGGIGNVYLESETVEARFPDPPAESWIRLRGEFGPLGRPALAFRLALR